MELKKLGIGVLMTAIFTPTQALMAAKAGADFVAPYVNRIQNICGDGIGVVAEIVNSSTITVLLLAKLWRQALRMYSK